MFEKIVPIAKKIILGSLSIILLGEWTTQIVEIEKSTARGSRGLMASRNVRILPVLSLYDLDMAKYILLIYEETLLKNVNYFNCIVLTYIYSIELQAN